MESRTYDGRPALGPADASGASASVDHLRALLLQMPAPVALHVGPEHVYALVNDAYQRVSGRGRALSGVPVREAFPELAGTGMFEIIDAVYTTGVPWSGVETPARLDRDGSGPQDAWFDVRLEPARDADGRVVGIINYSFEVTEQVRARHRVERVLAESEQTRDLLEAALAQLQEQALELELSNQQLQDQTVELELQAEERQATAAELEERAADAEGARQRTEAVLGAIADAFYLLDHEWRFTHVNDAAEPLLLTTRERLIGRTLWEAFPAVAGSVFEPAYREAMTTGRPTAVEAYFAPLGRWFDVRSYGWSGGLMVHFRDVSERRAAEDERDRLLAAEREAREAAEAARVEAEAANLAKSQFLSTMSHELRTPLNAIQGYAELLSMGLRGPVTDAQHTDFGRIRRASQHLMGLVTDILNFARLDAGQVEFHLGTVELGPLVADLEALITPQLAARGLAYDHDACGAHTPHAVRADAEKVRQVLLNLLTNAIKFTASGGRVSLTCGTDAAAGVVRLRVSDTGRGIAPEQIARIFEPFVQVDRHHTHESQQGVGLGLTISRDLARGMGGDLTVESTFGVGSTFTLTLPAA